MNTVKQKKKAQKSVFCGLRPKPQGCPLPLPPTAEQTLIVDKVDKLMALCDQLKVRLQSAQITQLQLTDSLLEECCK